jgi:hypothetical protein
MTSLRGRKLQFTYDQAPSVDGDPLDYSDWQLFEGTHLNSELGSRRLTISHGRLERILDFNTLSVTDRILP